MQTVTRTVYLARSGNLYFYELANGECVARQVVLPLHIAKAIDACVAAGNYQAYTDEDEYARLGKIDLADELISELSQYVQQLLECA